MKVLFYLEPWEEMGRPFFRLSTYINHMNKEVSSLLRRGFDVRLITSDTIGKVIQKKGPEPRGLKLHTISKEKLSTLSSSYYLFGQLAEINPNSHACNEYVRILKESLAGYKPDVIIAYETSFSQLLRYEFRDSSVIDSSLGFLSREPYPETFCYDPFGSFSKSALAIFEIDELNKDVSDSDVEKVLNPIQSFYRDKLECLWVDKKSIPVDKHEAILLLPLQVSNYFAFDNCLPDECKFNSQVDYILWVLSNVPKNVGIFVTEHIQAPTLNDEIVNYLRLRFENFIYDEKTRYLKSPSQYLASQLDGVITVSSSIGFHAALYNKYLCVIGRSHLSPLADANSLSQITVEKIKNPKSKHRYIHFLLKKYHVLFDKYVVNDNWLGDFIERVYKCRSSGSLNTSIFSAIDNDETIVKNYIDSERKVGFREKPNSVRRMNFERHIKNIGMMSNPQYTSVSGLIKEIETVGIVSFDIFDTLLARLSGNPKIQLENISYNASRKLVSWGYEISSEKFIRIRADSKNDLLNGLAKEDIEDVCLSRIYARVGQILNLSTDQMEQLLSLENESELRGLYVRKNMLNVFHQALKMKKRVFLCSDMYLDYSWVTEILEQNGISNYEKLFLSSSYGKLKRTGKLFDELIAHANTGAENILHIGDNFVSDYKQALAKGMKACLVSTVRDGLCKNLKRSDLFANLPNNLWHGLQAGISAKFVNNANNEKGDTLLQGSPYLLGVMCGGPIMLAFAQWVLILAEKAKISDLYFLARDGWYGKNIVDKLIAVLGLNIRTHYLLASRRLLYGVNYYSKADVLNVLNLNFETCQLSFLLEHRFGLVLGDHYAESLLIKYGFNKRSQIKKNDKGVIKRTKLLLLDLLDTIINLSTVERSCYLKYLEDIFFMKADNLAVVDIGHNGSLQRELGRLTKKKFQGFYYATFLDAKKMEAEGHRINSYYLKYEDSSKSSHTYIKNIGMYEFLFIPPQAGVVSIAYDYNHNVKPRYVKSFENKRIEVATQIEKGIYDFSDEFIGFLGMDILKFSADLGSENTVFENYLKHPDNLDAEIVKDICFPDLFGGFAKRYLIHPDIFNSDIDMDFRFGFIKDSWWKSGATAYLEGGVKGNNYLLSKRERYLSWLVRPFVVKIGKGNDLMYFNASPRHFFANLNNKMYRKIGEIFFGRAKKE